MRKTYTCERCRTINEFTTYTLRAAGNVNQPCRYCGTSHSCNARGEAHAIGPRTLPLEAGDHLRSSPHKPPEYRPILPGTYECFFRDDIYCGYHLYWTGLLWRLCRGGRRVDMRSMYKWRGVWEDTEE